MNIDSFKKEFDYMVCVYCVTFNHEKYIRQCLEGFVTQQTYFPFVVVVVDDASTDKTPSIVSEFAEKYPCIILPVFLKENHFSINRPKEPYLIPFLKKSKYVAFCEGDDYWTDPKKLQKQVDALEKHKDCKVCVHRVEKIYENGESQNKYLPPYTLRTGRIKSKRFIRMFCEGYPFQTNCYMLSGVDFYSYITSGLKFGRVDMSSDLPIIFYFGQLANAYYINENMSCYRVGGIGSHNERMINNPTLRENNFSKVDSMTTAFDEYTNYKYHKECLLNLQRYRYNRVVIAHYAGEITTEQYEKEIVKKDYRYFFKMENPLKARLLIFLRVYFPRLGNYVKQHFVHSK